MNISKPVSNAHRSWLPQSQCAHSLNVSGVRCGHTTFQHLYDTASSENREREYSQKKSAIPHRKYTRTKMSSSFELWWTLANNSPWTTKFSIWRDEFLFCWIIEQWFKDTSYMTNAKECSYVYCNRKWHKLCAKWMRIENHTFGNTRYFSNPISIIDSNIHT